MAMIKGIWRWNDGIENAPAPSPALQAKVSFISGMPQGDDSITYGEIRIHDNYNRVMIIYAPADESGHMYAAVHSYNDSGNLVSKVSENMRIMNFGKTEQEVSEEFYNFLVANATYTLTIADKVQVIAKNEQKVYDAGYNKGATVGYAEGYATIFEEAEPLIDNILNIQKSLIGGDE